MITLRIEHKISNYEGWKQAFENDPINRKKSGVKHYKIFRPINDPNFVIIDLDFENLLQAEAAKFALQAIFPKIEGTLIFEVKLKLFDVVESISI